jgi:hypothetical protein
MAQQSATRGQENQGFPQCFEHALGDLDQARELPYRPAAAQRRITGRTDGSIRLRATAIPKFSLATKGASTDGKQTPIAPTYRFSLSSDRPQIYQSKPNKGLRDTRMPSLVSQTANSISCARSLYRFWSKLCRSAKHPWRPRTSHRIAIFE